MEAIAVWRSGVPLVALTRSFSGLTQVDASLPTSARRLPIDGISSKRHRLLCRALPVESRNDVNLREEAAVKSALKVLEEDVQKNHRSDNPKVRRPPAEEVASSEGREGAVSSLVKTIADAVYNFLQFTPLDEENIYTSGNFAPVDEIGGKVPVNVISGAIPRDFPAGTYIRTGPNPLFGGKFYKSKLGITKHHWFEGDGMMHAVYFETHGDEHQLYYNNKYVETKGYLIEKAEGKPIVLATLEGTPIPLLINLLLNQLRFGFQAKPTCNTSVWSHGGRVFAASEQNLPHEINISDLTTMGEFNCKGAWPLDNFTAHPKIDPVTGELIFQGYSSTKKPYNTVGVVSGDGETLVHTVDSGIERPAFNHDIAITERYTVVMDFPLVLDPAQTARGKPAIMFDHNSFARFGILPRFGDASSVRWFQVETNAMFHVFNAYDNGNEVVVHGLRSRSTFMNLDMNVDRANWYRRGITPGVSDQEGYDPLVDGALSTYIHEWRFDLEAGTVMERDLDDKENYAHMEFPRINDSYVGRKYKYGYALCVDLDRAREAGVPIFGDICKVDFSGTESGKANLPPEERTPAHLSQRDVPYRTCVSTLGGTGTVKTEFHDFGPNRYGSEPMFVARPGSTEEDDGWIVTYVYDENTDQSEAVIIDARKFTGAPVARILLPQRVPFGFHGTYVHAR